MGLKLLSYVEIPQQGISLQNVIQTIKGDYNVKKSAIENGFVYNIKFLLFWYASELALFPIYQEEKIISVSSVEGIDIFNFIYTTISEEWTSKDINNVKI
jgi:hypothetical protein